MPEIAVSPEPDRPKSRGITDEAIAERVRSEVERTIRRQIKGLELITTPDPPVGLTPKDVVLSRGTMRLFHYRPLSDEVYRVPILVVTSLVSKAYILDLVPGQSFVEYLLRQGFDVFLVDWGIPRPEDSRLRIDDYVLDLLPDCVRTVQELSGEEQVSLVGYCLGGTLASMYAAANNNGPVKNLACFTTPVNFQGMGLQSRWVDARWFDVDRVVDTLGNVPPELLLASFDLLRPVSRAATQIRLWDNLWNDEFVRSWRLFDRWANDQIPFPGEAFRQMVKELMWENRLLNGTFELSGRPVNFNNITVPALHVTAEHDHIVPREASGPFIDIIGSEDREHIGMKGGHVSLVAGGNAIFRLWPQMERWLAVRSV